MNRRIFWRRKIYCLEILVMTQMDLPGKQAPEEHCSLRGKTDRPTMFILLLGLDPDLHVH